MTILKPEVDSPRVSEQEQWTIGRILRWSSEYLVDKGTPTPRLDAELLLANALACKRIDLYTSHDKPLTKVERDRFRGSLRRRAAGEPVAYILGEKDFWKHCFSVDARVLIPRPDTETLVEQVIGHLQGRPEGFRVLDVGTGSGCIAISIALEFPLCDVHAWDVSPAALEVARGNAEVLGATNVSFALKDALAAEPWEGGLLFDLVVSNPPYIAEEERSTLPTSVAAFEPQLALFANDHGLAFYRQLAERALRVTRPGGTLAVEVGSTQGEVVAALLRDRGWLDVSIHNDLAGLGRVVTATVPT